jgi:diguanylate cyclase (GGDEF)-like protein
MARTDLLTGCSNRRHFIERAVESIALSRRSGMPGALLMLDLDHFKQINDTYGHPVGDLVLVRVAKACLDLCRSTDAFGRVGGEEFALFLWNTDTEGAQLLAERVRLAIAALEIPHGAVTLGVTVSIGIAQLAPHEEFEMLYSRADAALYRAKTAGRNRVAVA